MFQTNFSRINAYLCQKYIPKIMKIKFFTLLFASVMLLNSACNGSGKGTDSNEASADSVSQGEDDTKPDGDAYIDYDRIVYNVVDGDTTEVNTYDDEGRLIVHRYQQQGEEGGDMYWCKEVNSYDADGKLVKTVCMYGEWETEKTYKYDNKGRLILVKDGDYETHYKWDGLTRMDDGFCRSEITYTDDTYQHIVLERSFVSNNGPLAWENEYDENGLLKEYRSYDDGKLSSAMRHEYKDNVDTETWISYNEDGSERKSEVRFKTDYLPNGKYNKILRTHIYEDGKEEIGYENEYDNENRMTKNGSTVISYDGTVVTKVDEEYDSKIVTCYLKKK